MKFAPLVMNVLFLVFANSSLAQEWDENQAREELSRCIEEYAEKRRNHEYHQATQDRLILSEDEDRGLRQEFLNGGEYEVLAFYHCMRVEYDEGYFTERGSFNYSNSFRNLRELVGLWPLDSLTTEIEVNTEWRDRETVRYYPKADEFKVALEFDSYRFESDSAREFLAESSPGVSIMREIVNAKLDSSDVRGVTQMSSYELDIYDLRRLRALHERGLLGHQGGPVVRVILEEDKDRGNYSYVRHLGEGKYEIYLTGSESTYRPEFRALADFLDAPYEQTIIAQVESLGISVQRNRIYGGQLLHLEGSLSYLEGSLNGVVTSVLFEKDPGEHKYSLTSKTPLNVTMKLPADTDGDADRLGGHARALAWLNSELEEGLLLTVEANQIFDGHLSSMREIEREVPRVADRLGKGIDIQKLRLKDSREWLYNESWVRSLARKSDSDLKEHPVEIQINQHGYFDERLLYFYPLVAEIEKLGTSVGFNYDEVKRNHVDALFDILPILKKKELVVTHIDLVSRDGESTGIKFNSAGDRFEIVINESGSYSDVLAMLTPDLPKVLGFFYRKDVKLTPRKLKAANQLRSLTTIGNQWSSSLPIVKIVLDAYGDSVIRESHVPFSDNLVIELNQWRRLDGYTELVQEFYRN